MQPDTNCSNSDHNHNCDSRCNLEQHPSKRRKQNKRAAGNSNSNRRTTDSSGREQDNNIKRAGQYFSEAFKDCKTIISNTIDARKKKKRP